MYENKKGKLRESSINEGRNLIAFLVRSSYSSLKLSSPVLGEKKTFSSDSTEI